MSSTDPALLKEKGERLVVTDYGLAHWISQGLNLDINELPKQRPDHINREAFDALRGKILKDYIYWNKEQMKPEQRIASQFMQHLDKEKSS